MARRRQHRRARRTFPILFVLAGVASAVWWFFRTPDLQPEAKRLAAVAPNSQLASSEARLRRLAAPFSVAARVLPEVLPDPSPQPDVSEIGAGHEQSPSEPIVETAEDRIQSLIKAGEQALTRDDLVAARMHFSEAVSLGPNGPELTRLRTELTRIGNETIFSPRVFESDPFVEQYIIQPGDALGTIAKANKVSAGLLAAINNLHNVNLIRAGQTIKIIKGPFHAVVRKQDFSLDVYLGNIFVKHFKVGLGADDSTPTGEWRVGTKLVNPTYYPPRGGDVIASDDPKNPLGERWIGLIGVGGGAEGQMRYGIHGTIEPESIGQSLSLGCIRMYNEDVELLYTYLVEEHSTVTVFK